MGAFATAVVAGPGSVQTLCDNLLQRIQQTQTALTSGKVKPQPWLPDEVVCGQALSTVTEVSKKLARSAPSSPLLYADLDWVVHYLFVFSRSLTRGSTGQEGLVPTEAERAATLAGYQKADQMRTLLTDESSLQKHLDSLVPAESLLVYYIVDGERDPVTGEFNEATAIGHTVTFFLDQETKSIFNYDPWVHEVFEEGTSGYEALVIKVFATNDLAGPWALTTGFIPMGGPMAAAMNRQREAYQAKRWDGNSRDI